MNVLNTSSHRNYQFFRSLLIGLFAVLALAIPGFAATTWQVPSGKATIALAITAASSGDTIEVAAGHYTLIGAGSKPGDFNLDPNGKNLTIEGDSGAIMDLTSSNGFFISYSNGESSASVLKGFTIENAVNDNGAIEVTKTSPTIENCTFIGNTAGAQGGAICINADDTTVNITITDCQFFNNVAGDTTANPGFGGAIEFADQGTANVNPVSASLTVTNCIFSGNIATYDGGAIDVATNDGTATNPTVKIINCSFSKNIAEGFGDSGSYPAPSAGSLPGGLIDTYGGTVTLTNGVGYGDTYVNYSTAASSVSEISTLDPGVTASYSDIQGGASGTGNINLDPLYISSVSGISANLRPKVTSPVINVANALVAPPLLDLDGNTRDSKPDMGAYEYLVRVTGDSITGVQNTGFSGDQVATFDDTTTDTSSASEFTASINWGDGTGASTGTISQPGGSGTSYVVTGSHTYTSSGSFTTTIAVTADGRTPAYSGTGSANISAPPAATHFTVSAPTPATAGTPFSVTVTAKDASNNVVTGYSGTVHFTSTDGGAGVALPADTTLTNGTGTLSATLVTTGSQTITATDTSTAITGTSNSITVNPGAVAHLVVSAPASATAEVSLSNVTVTAKDAFNNVATSYTGTVHFTSTDGAAVLPSNATLTNGTGTFSATLNTAGSQTITATDTVTSSITGTSNSITVNPGAATHFVVSAPSSATAGTSFGSVTVTAKDVHNNTATGYAGTVDFTSTDTGTGVILPGNATLTSGTGTFSATLATAGTEAITATDTVTSAITGTSNAITVSPGVVAHFVVSAPTSATAGVSFNNLTVTAIDAFNNVATSYSGTVHFTSTDTGTGVVLPANSTLTNGTGTFSATLVTAGTQTISALDGSVIGTSNSITVTSATVTHFVVSAPTSATAGVPFNVTVTAKDAHNNVVPGYTGTVHFTSTDGAAVLPANATLTNGTGTVSATMVTAGSQTITATDTVTSAITGTSNSITVNPGAATTLTLSTPGTASTGSPFNFTVTALDQYGNTATGYAGTVQFTSTDISATLPATATLTSGVGTFSATLGTLGNQTITATDTVTSSVTGTSGQIFVSVGTATHFVVSAPSTATAGTAFNFTVTAYDGYNNQATGYSGTVQFSSTDGTAVLPANATLTNGAGTFSATLNTSGSQTITATDTATSITGTSGSITVAAATGTPTANTQSVSTNENTAVGVTLTGSDPDSPPLALTYTVATGPTNGTLSGTAPNLTYTPNTGYSGSDSFTFTTNNGVNTSAAATVSITVNAVATDVSGQVTVSQGSYGYNFGTQRFTQVVTLHNSGGALTGPISLVLSGLSSNATLFNATGSTSVVTPLGRPYINTPGLAAGASETVTLQFTDPSKSGISYTTQVLAGPGLI